MEPMVVEGVFRVEMHLDGGFTQIRGESLPVVWEIETEWIPARLRALGMKLFVRRTRRGEGIVYEVTSITT